MCERTFELKLKFITFELLFNSLLFGALWSANNLQIKRGLYQAKGHANGQKLLSSCGIFYCLLRSHLTLKRYDHKIVR